jgi:hypothetical protein
MSNEKVLEERFEQLVPELFEFLINDERLVGWQPTFDNFGDRSFSFDFVGVTVTVVRDKHSQSVSTMILVNVGTRYLTRLTTLYRETGLGPNQTIKTNARTTHEMELALTSQAEGLRRLLPRLLDGTGPALIEQYHGQP